MGKRPFNSRRFLFSVYLSNAFEFFDYTLFGSLAVLMHKVFFPESFSLNTAVFTFCLSLIVRPLGSLVFGYIGDKYNRSLSLKLSVLTMACASILVAICPSYASIGITATVIIFISRILQGISAGGEYNGAAIFAIENMEKHKWVVSGFLTSSAIMGLVIALVVAKVLTTENMPEWSWRLGFLIGGAIGLASLYLRRGLQASILKKTMNAPQTRNYAFVRFFVIFFTGGQTSAVGYFLFIGIGPFLKSYNVYIDQIDIILTLLTASISCILYSFLSRLLNPYQLFKKGVLALGCLFPLSIWLLVDGYISTTLALSVSGISLGCHGAFQHTIFQQLARHNVRQRFISLAFSMGTGILTTAALMITQTHTLISLALYTCISLNILFLLRIKTTYRAAESYLPPGCQST